jgi:hypothetical protein
VFNGKIVPFAVKLPVTVVVLDCAATPSNVPALKEPLVALPEPDIAEPPELPLTVNVLDPDCSELASIVSNGNVSVEATAGVATLLPPPPPPPHAARVKSEIEMSRFFIVF